MSELIIYNLIILVALLISGVPVPLCFAAAAAFLVIFGDYPSVTFLLPVGLSKMSSLILLAIPLYILAGGIMSQGGIASRLIIFAESLVGRVRGGLGAVVIIATAVFGAISGMATSAVAAIGSVMIPRMVAKGYDRGYAAALVASSSVLALLIPPSGNMILYGWVTDTSITAVFLAPIIPGLLLIALFMFWNMILTRNMPVEKPEPTGIKDTVIDVAFKARRAAFGLVMPLIILGCIYGGITTPTEAAAIAVVYAIPVGLWIYKGLTVTSLKDVLWKSGIISAIVMMVVFFSVMLGRLYTMENVPQELMGVILGITENKLLLLLMINVFLLLVGMFMDDISGILLVSPLLLPLMNELGIHPVHFGAIIGVSLGMGLITPPTAPILYFSGMIGKTSLKSMLKPTLVFVFLAYLPVVLLTTFIPDVAMFLPRFILGVE